MSREERRLSLADYLNNHPTEAEKLRESINRFVSQSKLFESNVVPSLADTLAKIQQTTMQSLRPIYVPQLPESMFDSLRKTLKGIFPANWPSELPDFDRIEEVIEKDGIPIVHIPRAEIVQEICDAHDYDARVQILVDRASDIADDCRDALQRVYDEIVDKQLPLAQRAIEAYQAGYFESAQALAVSVCDTYLKKMYQGTRYADIQSDLTLDNSNEVAVAVAFNFHFALASAVPFLTPWNPARGEKPPTRLSRHASIHDASTDHMTLLNATIAIMLLTSMTVAIDYMARRVRKNKGDCDT